jgi:hypothetical protein
MNGWASGLPLRFSFDGEGLRVPMFAFYECAVCVLAVWIGITLLFMAYVMFVVFEEGCTIVARKLPEFVHASSWRIGRRRVAIESRKP